MASALVLDVGYVILEPSWHAVRAYQAATGTPMPQPDDVGVDFDAGWQETSDGVVVGDRYWGEVSRLGGFDGILGMFRLLGEVVPDALFDPAAVALMDDAGAAGFAVGILSNHAHMILSREWFAARPEFAAVTAFIDAAEAGVPKPDPQGYLLVAEAMGVAPSDVVFLDDTPACTAGADAVGMVGVLVDPADKAPVFARARQLLGLGTRLGQ